MKKIILQTLFFITLLSNISYSQTTGSDDCSAPTAINNLDGVCETFNYNAASANNGNWVPNCFTDNGGNPANLAYFSFTAQGANVDVDINGIDDAEVAIVTLTGTDWCLNTDVAGLICETSNTGIVTATLDNNSLVIGEEYYIVIDFKGVGNFDLCVDNPESPINDDCTAPTAITNLDSTCTTGTTEGAGPDDFFGSCWNTTYYSNGGGTVWYSFVADGNTADISVTGATNSYPGVAVYSSNDICDAGQTTQFGCAGIFDGGGVTTTLLEGIYPLTEGETYYVQVTLRDGYAGSFDICIDNPPNDPGDNCLTAEPFCTDEVSTFDAATDAVAVDDADDDCLLSQPNPKWFYLEIEDPGNLDITMSNTEGNDIDYAIWGPVTDLESGCETGILLEPIDCSFATDATEVGAATGTTSGELYIMVITNFENTETVISVEQTGGDATTNCAIVLPVELLSFNVTHNDDSNIITWSTATEENNDYFEVEYSKNGIDWRLIDTVSGSGTSSKKKNYSVIHRDFSNSINYYRLRQVDYNGEVDIFDPISIDNTDGREVVKTINLMGQEVDETYSGIVIIKYSDGTSTKVYRK